MYRSKAFRMTALAASLVMAFSLTAVDTAEARRGGSFGSRGVRTERVIPQTQTSPKTTTPVQRTETTTPSSTSTAANAARPRPSLFGGFAGAMLGGLLFSGLFGMLFGYGFGGGAGLLALLVQIGLVAAVVWFFTRRRRAAAAGPGMGAMNYVAHAGGAYAGGVGNGAARSNASRRAGRRDEIGITDADLADFERGLVTLQTAFAAEDMATLRRIATPEVVRVLTEELEDNRTRGVRNEVFDVQLLSGDIAESWREDNWEYATLALRYESRDILRDRDSGAIVSGDDRLTETTEVWTFRRQIGAPWIVSAIQEA